jgi:hypothetical protein
VHGLITYREHLNRPKWIRDNMFEKMASFATFYCYSKGSVHIKIKKNHFELCMQAYKARAK